MATATERRHRLNDLAFAKHLENLAKGIRDRTFGVLETNVEYGVEEYHSAGGVWMKQHSGEQTWTIRVMGPRMTESPS